VVLLESSEDNAGLRLLEAEVDDPAKVEEVLTHIGASEGMGGKSRRMVPLPAFDTEDIT
jgi:hypothetical protein